jgi:hypothetical protein
MNSRGWALFEEAKSSYKEGLERGRKDGQQARAEGQAGIWITLVGAILAISTLEHLTKWPWYVTYPLALIAGLVITAAYLKLKSFILRKS